MSPAPQLRHIEGMYWITRKFGLWVSRIAIARKSRKGPWRYRLLDGNVWEGDLKTLEAVAAHAVQKRKESDVAFDAKRPYLLQPPPARTLF